MRFLQNDSPLAKAAITGVRLFLLNFYWTVGCIPVVTSGASTIAAFSVAFRMMEPNGSDVSVTAHFWTAYRKNMKNGLALSLLLMGILYVLWLYCQLTIKLPAMSRLHMVLGLALATAVILHFLYVFPLEARYTESLFLSLHNSRQIFLAYPLRSLGLCLALAGEGYLVFGVNWTLFSIGMFIAPVLMAFTAGAVLLPIFHELEKK